MTTVNPTGSSYELVSGDDDRAQGASGYGIDRPRRKAFTAFSFEAGHFDHFAAFSYAFLRDCFGARYSVCIAESYRETAHRFAIAGLSTDFNGNTSTDSLVAVNPWLAQAGPILLSDHFSCNPGQLTLATQHSGVTVLVGPKVCKGMGALLDEFHGPKAEQQITDKLYDEHASVVELHAHFGNPENAITDDARYYHHASRG